MAADGRDDSRHVNVAGLHDHAHFSRRRTGHRGAGDEDARHVRLHRLRIVLRLAIDPLQVDDQTLGNLLEASDLSANPGLTLERVLEVQTVRPREIVLLSHPRNLAEADVSAAARRVRPGTRLFVRRARR